MLLKYIKGWLLWNLLKVKYGINYKKVVIVLSDENHDLDECVLKYLQFFMDRKHASSAIVFCTPQRLEECSKKFYNEANVKVVAISDFQIYILYHLYCFFPFFDSIVFTHTDTPSDNLLGRYIKETDINEEDATFLALFHLRHIPDNI